AYLALASVLLLLVPAGVGLWGFAALTALLVVMIVFSYEALLRAVHQFVGDIGSRDEHAFVSAFMDLNKKIHKFMQADDVLILVNDTLQEKVRVRKTVILLNTSFKGSDDILMEEKESRNGKGAVLASWPDVSHPDFLDEDFERAV